MKTTPHSLSSSSTTVAPFQRLDIYRVARRLVVVIHDAKIRDAELRDQATRAAKSVLLRMSEGLPQRSPGMRRSYFSQALGSATEVSASVDAAEAIGAIAPDAANEAQHLAMRFRQMLAKLK